jgi:hypothetical protein
MRQTLRGGRQVNARTNWGRLRPLLHQHMTKSGAAARRRILSSPTKLL